MKNIQFGSLCKSNFNKQLYWENKKGKERWIEFSKRPYFYIIPTIAFSCEYKKLEDIKFVWLFWELWFYRDVYPSPSEMDECETDIDINK